MLIGNETWTILHIFSVSDMKGCAIVCLHLHLLYFFLSWMKKNCLNFHIWLGVQRVLNLQDCLWLVLNNISPENLLNLYNVPSSFRCKFSQSSQSKIKCTICHFCYFFLYRLESVYSRSQFYSLSG